MWHSLLHVPFLGGVVMLLMELSPPIIDRIALKPHFQRLRHSGGARVWECALQPHCAMARPPIVAVEDLYVGSRGKEEALPFF